MPKKQLIGAFLGNLFEHYDTALFGLLAPLFATLFFPEQDHISALLLTYAMIPLGMITRPVGSLFFGYISTRFTQKTALLLSLNGMAVLSGTIACLPTYMEIGLIAPIFLCLTRILQNFFAAGEVVGGAIYILDHSSENKQDKMSALFNASTIAGILLASFAVSVLYYFKLVEGSWRVLYLLGCLTAFFASIIRINKHENEIASSMGAKELFQAFLQYRRAFFVICLAAGFSYATYSIALVFFNGFIPMVTEIKESHVLYLNTALLVLDFSLLPLFGYLATKFSREKMMAISALLVATTSFFLFNLLEGATLYTAIAIRSLFVILGVAFCAPFYSWAKTLVPKKFAYAIISFAYATGSQLFGGGTTAISLWLYKITDSIPLASLYLSLLALGCFVGITYLKKSSQAVTQQ